MMPPPSIAGRPRARWGRPRARWAGPSTCGPRPGSAPTSQRPPGCGLRRAGCGRCSGGGTTSAGGQNTPSSTCRIPKPWRRARRSWPRRPPKVAAAPERYEFNHEDETHVETNPYLTRVWHRRGVQPTVPAAGTNRRLTVFGSVEVFGRGRVEVVGAGQDSACFARYLTALDARHAATGKEMYLAIDNGSCHTSAVSRAALATRADWLHVIWLAKYSPELNRKEREWRGVQREGAGRPRPAPRGLGG